MTPAELFLWTLAIVGTIILVLLGVVIVAAFVMAIRQQWNKVKRG